jgi:hypothetical protein
VIIHDPSMIKEIRVEFSTNPNGQFQMKVNHTQMLCTILYIFLFYGYLYLLLFDGEQKDGMEMRELERIFAKWM